jgi:hypothetical protein
MTTWKRGMISEAGDDFPKPFLFYHKISKKQVMVDNDYFGLGSPSPQGI